MLDLEIWGFVIGVAGILLAVYFYVKQRVIKSASYWITHHILLGGAEGILPSEVVIYFQDKKISHLKKKSVIFWNSGNVTINKSNIVQMDHLRISMTGNADILKASIVRQSKPTNNATIFGYDPSRKEVCFDFDYLEPRQGLNIEILYQGEDDVEFMGTIKGIPEGSRNMTEREGALNKRLNTIRYIRMIFLAALTATVTITIQTLLFPEGAQKYPFLNIFYYINQPPTIAIIVAFLVFYILFAFFSQTIEIYMTLRVMPPKDLDV